jgi:hypothetical protein
MFDPCIIRTSKLWGVSFFGHLTLVQSKDVFFPASDLEGNLNVGVGESRRAIVVIRWTAKSLLHHTHRGRHGSLIPFCAEEQPIAPG